jgi:hypothetical protein
LFNYFFKFKKFKKYFFLLSLFSLKYVSIFSKTKNVYKNKNNQKTIAKKATNCAVTTKNV